MPQLSHAQAKVFLLVGGVCSERTIARTIGLAVFARGGLAESFRCGPVGGHNFALWLRTCIACLCGKRPEYALAGHPCCNGREHPWGGCELLDGGKCARRVWSLACAQGHGEQPSGCRVSRPALGSPDGPGGAVLCLVADHWRPVVSRGRLVTSVILALCRVDGIRKIFAIRDHLLVADCRPRGKLRLRIMPTAGAGLIGRVIRATLARCLKMTL